MNPKRWNYLKALTPPAPVMVHVSATAQMIPDPFNPHGPLIPYVQKPGKTYDVGRNKAKAQIRTEKRKRRERRRMLAKGWSVGPDGFMVPPGCAALPA